MIDLPLNVDFTGKIVVVTGAGGVLCGTMAKAFAQAGAKVAALDLNEDAVKKLADECKAEGFICEGYKANVLEPEALAEVHRQVLADLGPCDILVNGAGGNNPKATTDNEYQHEATEGQKTFFDVRIYPANENSGLFRRQGGSLQLYPVAGNAFRGHGYPLQCDCTGLPGIQSEQVAVV